MEIRRLRAFAEVARQGSFSAAADALNYTQPALSQQIAALEREVGVPLLKRKVRPVRPTRAGAALLAHATAILDRVTLAENQMRALVDADTAALRVGSFPTANATFVPSAIAGFVAESPDVSLTLVELGPADAERRLLEGEIDIAVIYDYPGVAEACEAGVDYHPLLDDAYRLVTPRDPVRYGDDIAPLRFLGTFTEGPAADCDELFGAVARDWFPARIIAQTRCPDTAQALVAAGLGIALLPQLALTRVHPGVAVRPAPEDVATRRILAAVAGDTARATFVASMLHHLQAASVRHARLSGARVATRRETVSV